MKLYSFFSKRLECFKDHFLATIKDDYELILVNVDKEMGGARKGNVHQWRWAIGEKKIFFLTKIIKENRNQKIIFADIDIQFFKPTKPIVEKALNDHDIVFQKEIAVQGKAIGHPNSPVNINTGFMAFCCNDAVAKLWNLVAQWYKVKGGTSQSIINQILLKPFPGITWGRFPEEIWNYSQGGMCNIPDNIILHHANCTIDAKKKWQQMKMVREQVE